MAVTLKNTDASLNDKTVLAAENDETVTGELSFERAPNAPFAVEEGSAKVDNLDADMVDGEHASAFSKVAENETITGLKTFERAPAAPFAVEAGSDTVANLDADTVDGLHASDFVQGDEDEVITGAWSFSQGVLERSRGTPMGEWTAIAYDAGNFSSDSGTWTVESGDVTTLAYTLIGKTMIVNIVLDNTTITGTPTELRIALPAGFTVLRTVHTMCQVRNNGTFGTGFLRVASGASVISVFKDAGAGAWSASAGNAAVRGQIIFELE